MKPMPLTQKICYIILAILALGTLVALDYYLPEKSVATIGGVGTKRLSPNGDVNRMRQTPVLGADIYFIYTQLPDGDIRVYRNENTGWGFPFYFKFDSPEIQGEAQVMSYSHKTALITSYGWRIEMFSMFPNVLDISAAKPDQSLISIPRWIGLFAWAIFWTFAAYKIWNWFKRKDKEAVERYINETMK